MCTKICIFTGQNETSEAPVWACASIGMKKYTARSFSYFFKAVLLLVWHPSIYWAILSLAHEHTHMGICTQETALAEDWIGFIHQSGIASLPLCCCDTPWNLGVSVRKEYFSNLCKDNYKCWLIDWLKFHPIWNNINSQRIGRSMSGWYLCPEPHCELS